MTASQWNAWFEASFNNFINSFKEKLDKALEESFDNVGGSFKAQGDDIQAIAEAIGAKKGADGIFRTAQARY